MASSSTPPESCTVLVAGGGPGGAYTAALLAREGIDVVLLEADKHPRIARYHIGESLLPSMRAYLGLVDLEEAFDTHGFRPKLGALFKLTAAQGAYTDFIEINGPSGSAWNVVRSESDEIFFRHAAKSGAKTFENIRLESLEFQPIDDQNAQFTEDRKLVNPGRPISAQWSSKSGDSGKIRFEYFVDATGRYGITSTKYLKNRRYNTALKNLATWGYYTGAKTLSKGERFEGQPMSEGMRDGTGWIWAIPLHNGTLSVGAVLRHDLFQKKKHSMGDITTQKEMLEACLKQCPAIYEVVKLAELVSDVKQASDYSYSASAYAGPYFRLVGDAGCFVDPLFSSGHHLALSSGLSAAVSISASIRGDCSEADAASYFSKRVTEGYTMYLLVVLAAHKQIRHQDDMMLGDIDSKDFDAAFEVIRPVIQGGGDDTVMKGFTREEIAQSVEYCIEALTAIGDEDVERRLMKMTKEGADGTGLDQEISEQDMKILKGIKIWDTVVPGADPEGLKGVPVDGLLPRLERGSLGLSRNAAKQATAVSVA